MSFIPDKPRPLIGHKRVDFKVVKEPFNTYKLKDDTILKMKFVLLMVFFEKDIDEIINIISTEDADTNKRIGMGLKSQIVFAVDAIDIQKGTPTTEKNIDLKTRIIEEDVDIVHSEEHFFEYLLDNGFTFKGKTVLINVDKTDIFDENGMPLYLVDTSLELKVILPKKIKELVTKVKMSKKGKQ